MWARILLIAAGIWLMVSPGVFDLEKKIADNAHIVGPLIVTFAIIALSDATRNVRLFIVPLGAWLLLAPWVLQYDNNTALINDYAVGVVSILLPFVKVTPKNRFGGGWPGIWKADAQHIRKAGNPDRVQLRTPR